MVQPILSQDLSRKEAVVLQVATSPLASRKWLWGRRDQILLQSFSCHPSIVDAYSVPGTVLDIGVIGINEFLQCLGEELYTHYCSIQH